MKIYLAGNNQKAHIINGIWGGGDIRIFLAGQPTWREQGLYDESIKKFKPFILESFYYVSDETTRLLPMFGDFLLDSGAFTFMQNSNGKTNWDEYLERYAHFVNKYKVEKFFELDIDSIVGYGKVLEYRKTLEKLTNRQCIPVWHENRGKDEFIRMCEEYSYVSIGSGDTKKNERLPWFISTAHKNNAKIHGLGFTALTKLDKYHFDSVDSTAWTAGNRFGFAYKFDGKNMTKIQAGKGRRIVDGKMLALNNFVEWVKFQQYALNHL